MENIRWRVDVTISSGVMKRVFKPVIQMQMILSNGSIKTFEVPIKEFHNLRLQVATVLHEIQNLEQQRIMQIKEF